MAEESKNINVKELEIHAYRYHLKSGVSWIYTARMLKAAADCIFKSQEESFDKYMRIDFPAIDRGEYTDEEAVLQAALKPYLAMFPVYMLLMGYALENVFKGIIICDMFLRDPMSVEVIILSK